MVRAATIAACSSIAILAGAVAPSSAAKAESVADFYKGNTLEVYSGNSVSGAYSTYARLMQRHIAKYLPGAPTTVMKFMPGAGGITFANWLYAVAPKDGTVFGVFHQRMGVEPLIAPRPAVKFDGRRFTWIGSLGKQSGVCFTWHTTPIKTVADAQANETLVGFSGSTSADAVMPRMMNEMLGTKFKGIGGYGGTDILLAMERGELQGRCGFGWVSLKTTRPDWIKEKKVNLLVQFALKSHPDLRHVPVMTDLVTNPDDRKALELVSAPLRWGAHSLRLPRFRLTGSRRFARPS